MRTFSAALNGYLNGVLQWEQWDTLIEQLQTDGHDWYVYAVGHGIPEAPVNGATLTTMLREINALLRQDHEEDYLGIVYVDDFSKPTLVKIYDPNNLGSSCGSCGWQIPPGWVLSRMPPEPIASDIPLPNNRRRWWQGLLGKLSAAKPQQE